MLGRGRLRTVAIAAVILACVGVVGVAGNWLVVSARGVPGTRSTGLTSDWSLVGWPDLAAVIWIGICGLRALLRPADSDVQRLFFGSLTTCGAIGLVLTGLAAASASRAVHDDLFGIQRNTEWGLWLTLATFAAILLLRQVGRVRHATQAAE